MAEKFIQDQNEELSKVNMSVTSSVALAVGGFIGYKLFKSHVTIASIIMVGTGGYFYAQYSEFDSEKKKIIERYENIIKNNSNIIKSYCADVVEYLAKIRENNRKADHFQNKLEAYLPDSVIEDSKRSRKKKAA